MKLTILLAEDDATLRQIIENIFIRLDHLTRVALDTDEALALLNSDQEIDLVWTDQQIPGEGGMTVLRRSKELNPARPVIICSGTADEAMFLAAGAAAVLRKPCTFTDVEALLERMALTIRPA